MKKRSHYKRSFHKYAGHCSELLRTICFSPLFRAVLLTAFACFLFLFLAPWFFTKTLPDHDSVKPKNEQQASFPLQETPDHIMIYRTSSKKTETIEFEDYVKGVVSGEMPSNFQLEALKAQSVAARTYSLARVLNAQNDGNPSAHPQAPLCDSTHCQVYRSPSELQSLKGSEWMKSDWKKICQAVDSTKGQLLYYQGELVQQALFHSSSGGKTENSEDVFASAVPYLVSVDSPYEEDATHQNEQHIFSIDEFAEKIRNQYPAISFGEINASNIEIISRSSGNRVEKMKIGKGILEGRSVREALELPSANFEIGISKKNNTIRFTTNGYGHGVGMSQYGADGMAKKGYDYQQILAHYYSGTEVW